MRKVTNYINEKFTQESDPISDLNIGLAAQLDKWIKTTDEYQKGFISKDHQLWICSKHNQVDFVRYLLSKGADVHADNDAALQYASENGKEQVVKILLDAGADVHADNDTALQWASYYGHEKVVKLLLDASADVHVDNDTALRSASNNGHKEVVKLLLDAGADVHARNDYALRWASQRGHEQIVKLLLDAGADVHARNDTALQWASERGHEQVVKLLKDHIAKEKKRVKESLTEKFTQESDSIKDLRIGIIERIKSEWDNHLSKMCNTFLVLGRYYSDVDMQSIENIKAAKIFYFFVYKIANIDTVDSDIIDKCFKDAVEENLEENETKTLAKPIAADIIYKNFGIKISKSLLESVNEKFTQDSDPIKDLGIGMDAKIDNWCKTTDNYRLGHIKTDDDKLWLCVIYRKIDFIKYLLQKGAIAHIDHALIMATECAQSEENICAYIIKLLIDAGANVRTKYGSTRNKDYPLKFACARGRTIIVKTLLENGAYVTDEIIQEAKYNAGINKYFDEVIKMLEDHMSKQKNKKQKYMRAKTIKEEAMGGVGSPIATLNTVPGMGNVVPATTTSFGSGDKWSNTIGGKPYTQTKPIKGNKKKTRKRKRRVDEENTNPYDKLANMMIKRMGKETKSPFKKKKSKTNQNAVVQRKFEHEIATFDEYLNEIYTSDLQNIPEESEIIDRFKDLFREKYPYISVDLINQTVAEFLSQEHINSLSIEKAVDLFADYVLSQGLADDVEE